jgi:beta-glucosidase
MVHRALTKHLSWGTRLFCNNKRCRVWSRWSFAILVLCIFDPIRTLAATPIDRADAVVAAMSQDEKLRLILGYFGAPRPDRGYTPPPDARTASAGYVPGIPRLGIPSLWETDAGIGVASQGNAGEVRGRTALPSGLATAATWDPDLAYRGGEMIGAEARASGFNVMLAGGVNLARDPRNGRNFEYAGEDPLLAGTMVGAAIRGIQSNHIIATMKHFALNDQETGRFELSANIDEAAARQSDLLAFELALEQGKPGAVMCAYNRVNGVYSCENDWLLNRVLKRDWEYPYFVMSDWGAVHSSAAAANAGLDQESAATAFDTVAFFADPLRRDIESGAVPQSRIDDMARRILRSMFENGLVDHPIQPESIDFAAHAEVSRSDAEAAIVLLKNEQSSLPLEKTTTGRIAIIGSHADVGVLSGGGSSQVYPPGGAAVPGLGPANFPGPTVYDPSSPLRALQQRLPNATLAFADGTDANAAASLAAASDLAIVFAHQWAAESEDTSLTLPDNQDALIDAVAAANARTIVVLETGGPVLMPWLAHVQAVLEAWYPGTSGGEAISNVLVGDVDASGRLPVTFPRSETQLPRVHLDDGSAHPGAPFDVNYGEGDAVGYKWCERQKLTPLFPFGFGLSYVRFAYSGLAARTSGQGLSVRFDVHNVSNRRGSDVPQVYLSSVSGSWDVAKRLGGWRKLILAPGAVQHVELTIDPRLLAVWDESLQRWTIAAGPYRVMLGSSSDAIAETADVVVASAVLARP